MTRDYIAKKYNLDLSKRIIDIPGVTRDDLAKLFCELNFNIGVEVGVLEGEYSEVLLNANPNLKMYGVDPWTAYHMYKDWRKQGRLNYHKEECKKRLAGKNIVFIEKFSMDAVKDFEDNSIDFVYIDGNHELPFVINDIYEWHKKVKPGGIISGHDYYKSANINTTCHVQYAVNAYIDSYTIQLFVLGRDRAPKGEARDQQRSWFFIKDVN